MTAARRTLATILAVTSAASVLAFGLRSAAFAESNDATAASLNTASVPALVAMVPPTTEEAQCRRTPDVSESEPQSDPLSRSAMSIRLDMADSCIEKDQACVLHGTPCCGTLECKGKFPNTTCQ